MIGPPVWLLHQTTSQPCFHVNKGNMDNKSLKFRRGLNAGIGAPHSHSQPWFWAITAHVPNSIDRGYAATPQQAMAEF
jgi:hypothetical protein